MTPERSIAAFSSTVTLGDPSVRIGGAATGLTFTSMVCGAVTAGRLAVSTSSDTRSATLPSNSAGGRSRNSLRCSGVTVMLVPVLVPSERSAPELSATATVMLITASFELEGRAMKLWNAPVLSV